MRRQVSILVLSLVVALLQQASAQGTATSPNYFQAVGYVVGQIRTVKWMEELCSKRFPDTKAKNVQAYSAWRAQYASFIDEMEGQFAVIEKNFRMRYPQNKDITSTVRKMSDGVDSQRQILEKQNEARGDSTRRWMCEVYPERVATRNNDLEKTMADRVAIIRRGPE